MNIYSKGYPFTEQPSPFYLHLLFLVFNRTYTYTVPIRFGKHVTYALTFGSDTRSIDFVFIDQDSLYGFRTRYDRLQSDSSAMASGSHAPTDFDAPHQASVLRCHRAMRLNATVLSNTCASSQ